MKEKIGYLFFLAGVLAILIPLVGADTYVADLSFTTSQTVYTVNERIELKGNLYLSNYSTNGSLVVNHSGLENATVVVSLIDKDKGTVNASYNLNTSTQGAFYSRSDYYTSATLISAPATAADYYVRVNYTDANETDWWTQTEVEVVNETLDRLIVSGDKVSYDPGEAMIITAEAEQAAEEQQQPRQQ